MANPLLDRYAKRQHGQKSERRIARKLGARQTPGSGSLHGAKGDSVLPELLIESKSTVRGSLSLQKKWLDKITREALARNRRPALTISFVNGDGKSNTDWIAVPVWLACELGIVPWTSHKP